MIFIYLIETRLKKWGRKITVRKGMLSIELMEKSGMCGFLSKFEPSAFQTVMASSNGKRLCEGTPIYRTNLDSPGVVSLS